MPFSARGGERSSRVYEEELLAGTTPEGKNISLIKSPCSGL
jgi:hypothetical protein